MEKSYPFGGVAGETVRRFTAFSTLFTLFPALVLTGVLALAAHFFCRAVQLPAWMSFLVSMIFTSPVIAKSALAARDGDLSAGFLSDWNFPELVGFLLRYTVLTIAWGVPVVLAANALAASVITKTLTPLEFVSARGAMLVLELVVLTAVAVIAPTLTLIIATREQSIGSCFSGEPWAWLLNRRGDLPAYYSAAIGGAVVFSLLMIPVMLVVVALAFLVRIEAGMAAAAVVYGLLAVGGAVLVGRLSGAFVLSETDAPQESVVATAAPVPRPARPVPTPSPAAPQPAGMDSMAIAVKKLVLTEDAAVPAAIAEAETLRLKAPDHPGLLAELAKLYLRAQRTPEAIATASEAISRAVAAGELPLAVACYEVIHGHRKNLTVKGPDLEQLGRGLLDQKKFAEAAWCYASSGRTGGDAVRVQKGLIASAEGLNKLGQLLDAKRIYQFVVNFTPGSSNAQYCQDAMARINSRLKKTGA